MIYKQMLEGVYEELEKRRDDLKKELAELPDGNLNVEVHGDSEYYRLRIPRKGNMKKTVRKTITKDKALVMKLVRKKYVSEALSIIESDLPILSEMIKEYKPFDENSVMEKYVSMHPALADGIYKDVSDMDGWANHYNRQKDFFDSDLTSVSGDRTVMRSRGEILIAEKLRQYGIPFRYEASLEIPDLLYVPDFTIKRPQDGKIFYWEHFGDVMDEEYMNRNAMKVEMYERYGIVPWDNLIITYDFANGGVNVPLIEGMIHAWLL